MVEAEARQERVLSCGHIDPGEATETMLDSFIGAIVRECEDDICGKPVNKAGTPCFRNKKHDGDCCRYPDEN